MTQPLTIDRLALRGGDEVAVRRRALWRLEQADPVIHGPPRQVLIVRRLDDPLPGALGRAKDLARWEAATSQRLAALSASAVRPAGRGADDAAGAEAVIFADEAEMYACLLERLAGRALPVWWARALLRQVPPPASVTTVLPRRPDLVPAICEALLTRGSAVKVLGGLGQTEVDTLCSLLGAAPLPSFAEVQPEPATSPWREIAVGTKPADEEDHPPSEPADPVARDIAGTLWGGPVQPELLSALAALPESAARLLAVAWLRRRRPMLAGSRLSRTVVAMLAARKQQLPLASRPRQENERRDLSAPAHSEIDDGAVPPDPDEQRAKPDNMPVNSESENADAVDLPEAGDVPEAQPITEPLQMPPRPFDDEVAAADVPAEDKPADTPAQPTFPETGVATALGGVFFLVNLYDGLIAQRAPALQGVLWEAVQDDEGPWAAVERLARAILHPETAGDDGVWRLMATLDGRPPDKAIWPGPADKVASAAACAWMARAGWGVTGAPADEGPADLMRIPARVFVTSMHLDVLFAPDAVCLPARRAGLDFDPGWQPRFGRVITFHFRE